MVAGSVNGLSSESRLAALYSYVIADLDGFWYTALSVLVIRLSLLPRGKRSNEAVALLSLVDCHFPCARCKTAVTL